MAVDPVPYVVHGAKHSADVFRQSLFDNTGGAAGVSSGTSLHVRQTGTPSNQVRVNPGGVIIPNTYQGGEGQSYTGRNASETLVTVPASDSTGPRTWNIIFRVQDPQFGGPSPSDPLAGPYSFIECVAKSAEVSDPHYVLAEITVPASTATITNAMITSRRKLALPKREQLMFGRPRVTADNGEGSQFLTWKTEDGGEYFPGGGGNPNSFEVFVPEWASRIMIDASWMAVKYNGGNNPHGRYWVEYGDEYRPRTWPNKQQYEFSTQKFAFDSPGSSNNNMRTDWRLMSSQPLPAKLRGKTITVVFKAGRNDDGSNTAVEMDAVGGLGMHIAFVETTLDPSSQEEPA
jgi:hypothetical protein